LEVDSLGPNTRDYSMWLDPVLVRKHQAPAKK